MEIKVTGQFYRIIVDIFLTSMLLTNMIFSPLRFELSFAQWQAT